jgi:uncharacterized OB-fold protein
VNHDPQVAVDWPPSPEAAEFWRAAEQERLLLAHCDACGATFHHQRVLCPVCGAPGPGWVEAGGKGTIFSHTTVHTSFYGETWAGEIPYVVVLVALEEGPRILSRLAGDDAGLRIGAPVRVAFRRLGGRTYPFFALDQEAPS